MSDRPLGAAVVGMRMGNQHAQGYVANPATELRAICDPDEELLAQRCEEYPGVAAAVTDFRELLERDDLDVVSVASPDYYHAEQSIAFLERGTDVLCEKPLTLDIGEARSIVAAVRRTERKFMVGQVCRYAPGFVKAREIVASGEIGRLFFAESEYAHNYRGARGVGDWRVDPRREPVIGGGCHAVDLLRWVAGDVAEVSAYSNHLSLVDWPVEDCAAGALKFANGVVGKVLTAIGCHRPYTMRSVFWGSEGTVICDNTSRNIRVCSKSRCGDRLEFEEIPVDIANHNVSAEIDEFVSCIVNDQPVATDVVEGAKTVATCLALVQSARSGGRSVRVADVLGDG